MADEVTTVVCTRVADGPSHVAGATITHCHQCGNDVWLSPSSAEIIARKIGEGDKTRVMCIPCVGGEEAALTRWVTEGMHVEPEQRDELRGMREGDR